MWRAVAAALATLQAQHTARAVRFSPAAAGAGESCAELANMGTHFTVDVCVGTPCQKFSVVADTGSNTLIVPSCMCKDIHKEERCFTGTNKSSSFILEQTEKGPVSMVLSYGSGDIQGVLVKDRVQVGNSASFQEDGLLLMVDKALKMSGPFEGILGLGVPQRVKQAKEHASSTEPSKSNIQDIIQQIMGNASGGSQVQDDAVADDMRKVMPNVSLEDVVRAMLGPQPEQREPPKSFIEQAKIDRFSICFNEGSNGVLRLGTDASPNAHGGAGTDHWGLDFRGVSIGNKTMPAQALFCHPKGMSGGQATPCGAIPDSGTTLLMGPEEQVDQVMAGICDGWERCRANFTALQRGVAQATQEIERIYGLDPFHLESSLSKAEVVQLLLLDCASWMDEEHALAEMPPLHFHVVGSNGSKQTLTIPAHLYVMETTRELMSEEVKLFRKAGIAGEHSGAAEKGRRACTPALGPMDYKTRHNGPVWILGTPLFYQFVVGYDISANPPSIAFSHHADTPCGTCSSQVDLAARAGHPLPMRRPLRVNGPPRMPRIDTSKPL